jgi:hypothetical protein
MAPGGMVPIERTSTDHGSAKMTSRKKALRLAALAAALGAGAAAWSQPFPTPAGASESTLLREGSYILQAKGTLERDADTGWWKFKIAAGDRHDQVGALTLLPCTLLESLEQLVEATPDEQTVFDLTGQVFVYHDRNYLLPTHAPQLVTYRPPPAETDGEEPDSGTAEDGESADSILRELDEAVGPVLRSSQTSTAPDATTAPDRPGLVPPGTLILWRRGWMVREPGGAWAFVFEADATGLQDPPMIIYPCLLLEEMEVRRPRTDRSGLGGAVLVSGRVERYRTRNYLLPTAYQIPYHRTPLRP